MDKRKIVKIVAKKNGMSQKDVTMVFDEIFQYDVRRVKEEGHVGIGFWIFQREKMCCSSSICSFNPKSCFIPGNSESYF